MNEIKIDSVIEEKKQLRNKIEAIIQASGAMKPPVFSYVYEKILTSVKVKSLFEIGIHKGGSIRLWRELLGSDVLISALDIKPEACDLVKEVADYVYEGSQTDSVLLTRIANEAGPFDLIIDDGSHQNAHMIKSMELLFEHLRPGGIYIVEDMFTSYWPKYGGGLNYEGSFVEYLKGSIDNVYSPFLSNKYKKQFRGGDIPEIEHSFLSKSIKSVEFYSDGVVAIYKSDGAAL